MRSSRRPAREAELLAVTLRQLQLHGFERLTMDQIAEAAGASKATLYRHWPSKGALVLSAVNASLEALVPVPDTGSLRGDLLTLGKGAYKQLEIHGPTFRALLFAVSSNPALQEVLHTRFYERRKVVMDTVLQRAVDRGEIEAAAIYDELWDLLPGYLAFRAVIQERPPTDRTVESLVDGVLLPSLTRLTR